MASSIFLNATQSLSFNGTTLSVSVPLLFPDGTSGAPAMAFASEPTLGFWRSSAANVTFQGSLTATVSLNYSGNINGGLASLIGWAGTARLGATTGNQLVIQNSATTIGSVVNVGALPTIASGFGAGSSITAGSTPFAGSVNVGTGAATTGVINFNGTAFPSAPFVVCMNTTTAAVVRAVSSGTQLTVTAPVAWTDNDIVCWCCISSK